MKNLRTLLVPFALTVLSFSLVTYTACKKEKNPCDGISCINGGACNNGVCICPSGYEGTYCESKIDPCKGITCKNGGACSDGKCNCSSGYEGTYCEIETRTKFFKNNTSWTATDIKTSDGMQLPVYQSNITAGATIAEVKISNFSSGVFTNDVKGTVSGNTITIAEHQPDNDGYSVFGTGIYNPGDKKLTWSYIIKQISTGNTLSFTGVWQ